MPKALSLDLRERILEAWKQGLPWAEIADRFQLGIASVNRLVRRYRKTGSVERSPRGGGNPPKIPENELPSLKELVERPPLDAYLEVHAYPPQSIQDAVPW